MGGGGDSGRSSDSSLQPGHTLSPQTGNTARQHFERGFDTKKEEQARVLGPLGSSASLQVCLTSSFCEENSDSQDTEFRFSSWLNAWHPIPRPASPKPKTIGLAALPLRFSNPCHFQETHPWGTKFSTIVSLFLSFLDEIRSPFLGDI